MVVIMEVKIKYLVKYTIESTILKLYLDKIQIMS
jgi:NADPH-dependent 7-cyano-7-deazaguanine reductase QueF-like protein